MLGYSPAQELGPKAEPSAMSSDYNPLIWQGDDAQFAIETKHTSYCRAEFSKNVAVQTKNSGLLDIALTNAEVNDKLLHKLNSIARELGFHFPAKAEMVSCPDVIAAQALRSEALEKSYRAFLRQSNANAIDQFRAEIARPERPDNYSLRKLAKKTLPVLMSLQAKLDVVDSPNR